VDLIKGERVQLVINTPQGLEPWFDEKAIRRATINNRIPTITTIAAGWAAANGIAALQRNEINVRSLQEWHGKKSHATRQVAEGRR
jgi:carbamoyl-phosphate synthase large subunit